MIESYELGQMTIDGKIFTSDLAIQPNGTVDNSWWRTAGMDRCVKILQGFWIPDRTFLWWDR